MENSLKLAGELDPALKAAAAAQAELCRQVEAVLKPRRAAAAGDEERRRRAPENP